MNLNTLNLIYFSPTGTTQKIVKQIGEEIKKTVTREFNITKLNPETIEIENAENSLTVIGIPVYSGRLPLDAVDRLQKMKANGAYTAIVVVYGNRAYDDALIELKTIASQCGFKVIAASAFIGEHSFSTAEKPIATNRPDAEDLLKAKEFGSILNDKFQEYRENNSYKELEVPGNDPFKPRGGRPQLSPETIDAKCNSCKVCESVCPVNAITIDSGGVNTDKASCIWCCACVKACAQSARIFENPVINDIQDRLSLNCKARKEPELFY